MPFFPAIEKETHPEPDATVIILHGLGASGHDFVPIVPELQLPQDYKIRFIFPHAPERAVTVNNGYVMPAWFDIMRMEIEREVDTEQLMLSADKIRQFVDREIERGIAPERIIVAGFSQGGAVAYQLALTYPKPLCGLLAMSTYFATADIIELNPANKNIPIEIQHGLYDPIVPILLGERAAEQLKGLGYQVTTHNYPMDHSVCQEQIGDISAWIQEVSG